MSTKDEGLTVSPTCTKPNVGCRFLSNDKKQKKMIEIINDGHSLENLPNGFSFEVTPSHGYLCVQKQIWDTIPFEIKTTPFSDFGRFEEDCDWCIPIVFNLKLFNLDTQKKALQCFKYWYRRFYDKYFLSYEISLS